MDLNVISTGSKGNAYVLSNENESLLIECGGQINDIKSFFDFSFKNLVGCLISHEHADHSKNAAALQKAAVNLYSSAGTFEALKLKQSHRSFILQNKMTYKIGNFYVQPFKTEHDAKEPFGFQIFHNDCGTIVFLTDSYYSKYKFSNPDHFIIEANYSEKFMSKAFKQDMRFLRDRILNSHLSIENCVDLVKANMTDKLKSVVLVHLSDSNSNEVYFKKTMQEATGKQVFVADNNMKIELT